MQYMRYYRSTVHEYVHAWIRACMGMYVCSHEYVLAWMHERSHAWMYANAYAGEPLDLHACTQVPAHMHEYDCKRRVCMHPRGTRKFHACPHPCMRTLTNICTCMHTQYLQCLHMLTHMLVPSNSRPNEEGWRSVSAAARWFELPVSFVPVGVARASRECVQDGACA